MRLRILTLFLIRYLQKKKLIALTIVLLISGSIYLFPKLIIIIQKPSVSQGVVGTHTEDDLPIFVTALLSDGLIKIDEQGRPKPNLVASWDVNQESKEYVFKLRENIFWNDGTKIKAEDLAISIPGIQIEVVDELIFKIKLTDSFSPLPTLLTKPIFKKGTNIGTGPYSAVMIEKNFSFIKKIILTSSNQDLPQLTIRFYPNEKIAKSALMLGEVQSIIGINETYEFDSMKPFKISTKTNYSRLVAIFYNTQDKILSDKNFRLALGLAAPLIENETEAKTPIPPFSWAFNQNVRDFLNDTKGAKDSLNKVEKGKDETITLTTTTILESVGERIVYEWNQNGIKAVLRVESGVPQNFQALLITQDIPIDPDQYSLWHSTQDATNISKYKSPNQYSPRVDKDLEDGRKTTDEKLRKERYLDFQRVLLDDSPATFLYFPKFNVVYLSKIEGQISKVLDLQYQDLQLTH